LFDCAEDAVSSYAPFDGDTSLIWTDRFIETHSKTLTNAIALLLSIGGWFLWNIILSSLYKPDSKIYYVRDTFLHSFGSSLSWWLCLVLILLAVLVLEFAVQSLLGAYLITDEHVFQVLEKDPAVKRRFEEAAAGELQQGWDRKTNKSRDEQMKVEEVVEGLREKEEERREGEIKDLLRNRVTAVEERHSGVEDGKEINKILSRGYGDVKRV
jgi:phospholipid-translocating ATPase